jgi:two-component system sensor histidine kinase YesM
VENAIRHGIEPRRGPGMVWIEARREGSELRLMVRDDGRGAGNGSGERVGARGEGGKSMGNGVGVGVGNGVGLANTRARLEGLYGQEQSFTFGRVEPQGFRVDVRIPLRWAAAAVAGAGKELAG